MSDDAKKTGGGGFATMPPELRAFVKPEPAQKLVAADNESEFKAAVDALRLLNGVGDPFYVDPKGDPAAAERKAPPSVAAHVPPVPVPAPVVAATARVAVPGRVVIIEARPIRERALRVVGAGAVLVIAVLVVLRGMSCGAPGSVASVEVMPARVVPASPIVSTGTVSAGRAAAVVSAAPPASVVPAGSVSASASASSSVLAEPKARGGAMAPRLGPFVSPVRIVAPSAAPAPQPPPPVSAPVAAPKPTVEAAPGNGEIFNRPRVKQSDDTGR